MAGPNLANLPCLGFTIDKGMAIIAKIKQAKMEDTLHCSSSLEPKSFALSKSPVEADFRLSSL